MLTVGVQTGGAEARLGIDRTYRVIREAGFDAVDAGLYECMPPAAIRREERAKAFLGSEADFIALCAPYREAAERYGLFHSQAHAIFPTYGSTENHADYDEFLMKALQWSVHACDSIGCRNLVVHPAFHGYGCELAPEEERRVNLERYARLIPAAKEYGVTVCLENMFLSMPVPGKASKKFMACCSDAFEAVSYIDELNTLAGAECFGFCFDIGHAHLLGRSIVQDMQTLGSRIKVFHLHDNDGISDQHLAPYMGNLNWDLLTEGLKRIRFQGTLSFETLGIWDRIAPELCPSVMRVICEAGRLFAKKAEQA